MTRRRHPKNRRKWKHGWQTYLEVHGKSYAKSWPANADPQDMADWVDDQRRTWTPIGPTRGSFAADVTDYKTRISATRTYRQLSACLDDWLTVLGPDRPRRTIKAGDIDAALQQWDRDGMGASSLQKHRMVLMALWNRLDGKDAPNPVRATPRPQTAKPEARAVPYATIRRIVAQMPAHTPKQRQAIRRVTVIVYTGIPPGMLARITPPDLNLRARTVRVHPRRKGRGVEARTLPLIPPAVTAFRAFHLAGDYGAFRPDVLSRAFKHAARAAGASGVRLYDMRHSFATELYRETKDLDTVARFLQHSTTALTARYAKGATDAVDKAAAAALGRTLSRIPVPKRRLAMKP